MQFENISPQIARNFSKFVERKPKLMILGIGENRMGDDGLGQYIAFYLDQQIDFLQVKIINGGIVPEERLDEIIEFQPNLLILIDSVDSRSSPGTLKFYDDSQMLNYLPISSHSLPLPILVNRCKSAIPGLKIKLLGIQPFSLEFRDHYVLFEEQLYSLDAKEANPNIPFYAFNLTPEMELICKNLVSVLVEVLKTVYS